MSLAIGGLLFLWLAHDLEELVMIPDQTHPLFDKAPLLPEDIRRHGCSRKHVYLGIGLMGILTAVASADGYRTRGRSSVYQAVLYGHGMHTFNRLGSAALTRHYTSGVATALPAILPFQTFAERTLRVHGVKACPHRWVIPAFPVITGTALGSTYLVATGRSRERH